MTESDCEIEFLDEDAEIVQQCVQTVDNPESVVVVEQKVTPLLVERKPTEKRVRRRRRKRDEEDSDYDPSEDVLRYRKRKTQPGQRTGRVGRPPKYATQLANNQRALQLQDISNRNNNKKQQLNAINDIYRKTHDIRIPDYDDPLCLPVKSVKRDESDVKKLKNWNNLCLDHLKNSDNSLKPDNGVTASSKRTLVLRNVKNKLSGRLETTIWSKTSVENEDGDRKSEVFQCVLPKYREKKILDYYINDMKRRKIFHNVNEVVLTKENLKDGEILIAYKPREALSSIYKFVEEEKSETKENKNENNDKDNSEESKKKSMKEVASCKVCAPCYQTSWRGAKKNEKKSVRCAVCARTYVSTYNLLAHLRTHAAAHVRHHRRAISRALANVVDYHYKCRICQEQFLSIRELRKHVTTHQGTDVFICEVGNHMAR